LTLSLFCSYSTSYAAKSYDIGFSGVSGIEASAAFYSFLNKKNDPGPINILSFGLRITPFISVN